MRSARRYDPAGAALAGAGAVMEGVSKLRSVRARTGSLEPHFFTQNSQNYFFSTAARRMGVRKSRGFCILGPVALLRKQKVIIKYKKPLLPARS